MSTPLRVNNRLYQAAEAEGSLLNRSTAKQIEFWAELGKRVAHSITSVDMLALMQGIAKVNVVIPTTPPINPQDVFFAVDKANATQTLGQQITRGSVYYEANKDRPDLLDQISPDGTRVSGHFKEGKFLPE